MNLDDLRGRYGDQWTIRTWPAPGATRRQQIGQIDGDGHAYAPAGLSMNLYATSLEDLAGQLADQEKLLAAAHERGGADVATPYLPVSGTSPRTTTPANEAIS